MTEIVEMALDDLLPDPDNAMTHSDAEMQRLVGSVGEYGFLQPVVWNKRTGHIVGGHARVEAARAAGLETVPTVVVDFDETREAAANLALNGNYGHWDDEALKKVLAELQEVNYDLDLTGIEPYRLDELLASMAPPALTDPDDVPEAPAEPITKLGDVILLGKHRLMCGDSTSITDVESLMNGEKADMVWTDPPYGASSVKNNMVGADFGIAKKGSYMPVIGDDGIETAQQAYAVLSSLGCPVLILWGANYYASALPISSSWIVWDKRADTGIENTFADCELAWTSLTGPSRIYRQLWNGMIRSGEHDKRTHPTQKPVALAEWCYEKYGKAGDRILDLFGGSGTAMIAAEQTNRTAYLMDIDPHYCDVIVARWEAFTGKTALRPERAAAPSFASLAI